MTEEERKAVAEIDRLITAVREMAARLGAEFEIDLKKLALFPGGQAYIDRLTAPSPSKSDEAIVEDRADWLVDAVAGSTQDRQFLRGDPEENCVATEAIEINGKKAIAVALATARRDTAREIADWLRVRYDEEVADAIIERWGK